MRTAFLAAAFVGGILSGPVLGQSDPAWNHNLYESGPGGLPPISSGPGVYWPPPYQPVPAPAPVYDIPAPRGQETWSSPPSSPAPAPDYDEGQQRSTIPGTYGDDD
jgi:hypothetical protein